VNLNKTGSVDQHAKHDKGSVTSPGRSNSHILIRTNPNERSGRLALVS
jgi:hypothetical protein